MKAFCHWGRVIFGVLRGTPPSGAGQMLPTGVILLIGNDGKIKTGLQNEEKEGSVCREWKNMELTMPEVFL